MDSSLTDFAVDDPADPADGSADDGNRSGSAEAADAAGAADPIETTYEWDPAGTTCATCGERTTRRWRTDGGLVCADCKAW